MTNCCICLDNILENNIYKTSCNHIFHHTCLQKWFEKKKSCPYCRNENIFFNMNDTYNKYNLFHDEEFYYFYDKIVYPIKKRDIEYIEQNVDMSFFEKLDIIISFVKNNYNIHNTIMELINFSGEF